MTVMDPTLNVSALPAPIDKTKFTVVDADAHIDPPHTFWGQYLPENLRALAPTIEEGNDHDWVVFEGRKRPLILLNNQAGREGKNFKVKGKMSDILDVSSVKARLDAMDTDGVDIAVLFGGGPLGTMNNELYIESYRAYNRWLADFCAEAPTRLAGVAYLPMRDIDESIALLREAAKLGHRSINIPAFPQDPEVENAQLAQGAALTGNPASKRAYWHPEYDRFWAEVCELDVAVTFHLGGRGARFTETEHFLPDLVMTKVAMAEPVAMAIYGGLFDRFPKMRWGIIESGVGWMAWMAEYMDRTWSKQRFWTGSAIKHQPSFYMDQNIYGSYIYDRTAMFTRDLPGGKNIMWSSDFPHSETSWPRSLNWIAHDCAGLPDDDIREIIGGRAKTFFRID